MELPVIFLVDPDVVAAESVVSQLSAQGWWVSVVPDGDAALRAAASHAPKLVIAHHRAEPFDQVIRAFGRSSGGPGVILVDVEGDVVLPDGADAVLPPGAPGTDLVKEARRLIRDSFSVDSAESDVAEEIEADEELAPEDTAKFTSRDIFGDMLDAPEREPDGLATVELTNVPAPLDGRAGGVTARVHFTGHVVRPSGAEELTASPVAESEETADVRVDDALDLRGAPDLPGPLESPDSVGLTGSQDRPDSPAVVENELADELARDDGVDFPENLDAPVAGEPEPALREGDILESFAAWDAGVDEVEVPEDPPLLSPPASSVDGAARTSLSSLEGESSSDAIPAVWVEEADEPVPEPLEVERLEVEGLDVEPLEDDVLDELDVRDSGPLEPIVRGSVEEEVNSDVEPAPSESVALELESDFAFDSASDSASDSVPESSLEPVSEPEAESLPGQEQPWYIASPAAAAMATGPGGDRVELGESEAADLTQFEAIVDARRGEEVRAEPDELDEVESPSTAHAWQALLAGSAPASSADAPDSLPEVSEVPEASPEPSEVEAGEFLAPSEPGDAASSYEFGAERSEDSWSPGLGGVERASEEAAGSQLGDAVQVGEDPPGSVEVVASDSGSDDAESVAPEMSPSLDISTDGVDSMTDPWQSAEPEAMASTWPAEPLDSDVESLGLVPIEEPAVEEPTIEEPAIEESVVEEPVVEERSVEEPSVEVESVGGLPVASTGDPDPDLEVGLYADDAGPEQPWSSSGYTVGSAAGRGPSVAADAELEIGATEPHATYTEVRRAGSELAASTHDLSATASSLADPPLPGAEVSAPSAAGEGATPPRPDFVESLEGTDARASDTSASAGTDYVALDSATASTPPRRGWYWLAAAAILIALAGWFFARGRSQPVSDGARAGNIGASESESRVPAGVAEERAGQVVGEGADGSEATVDSDPAGPSQDPESVVETVGDVDRTSLGREFDAEFDQREREIRERFEVERRRLKEQLEELRSQREKESPEDSAGSGS